MPRTVVLIAALTLLCRAPEAGAEEPNPFGPALSAGSPELLDREAMLGISGSEAALTAWLAAHPGAPAGTRAALYHRLCEIFGLRSRPALRARACAMEQMLAPRRSGDDDASMAAALADALPIQVTGSATIALQDNALGSKSADVTVNGITFPWFVDTGAEISVLPRSNADRLGVHYVGGPVNVGTTTHDVTGRIAIIDVLAIGNAVARNVPVLVLPDERLRIDGLPNHRGVTIPGILGLPLFVAFRRMAWVASGTRLTLGEDTPHPAGRPAPIYWHDDGLGIGIETARGVRGVHFDSGADSTYLYADGRDLPSPRERAAAVPKMVGTWGAGGTVERRLAELPCWTFRVGATPVTLGNVTLADDPGKVARIGADFLRRFRVLALDFERMTLTGEILRPSSGSRSCGR